MRSRLLSRLENLESRSAIAGPRLFRYGWLKRLPDDFAGERHVVITKREPTASPNFEWCEFEERAGPVPPNADDGSFCVCLSK